MADNYYVYKLYNSDCTEFYIGSTMNMKRRKYEHKHRCNKPNSEHYNYKVYEYIRSNGGYSSWNYEILEHITTSINKYELHDLERKAIEDMKPGLNNNIPNRSKNEYRQVNREAINEKANQKFNCICGGKYTKCKKARHIKSNKHLNFIRQ